jgi:acyl carrier protein
MALQEVTKERAIRAIFSALDKVNDDMDNADRLPKAEDCILFGDGGRLDSIGLVSLILSVERAVAEEFGVAVTLADERALSERNSPFRTVEALANYITGLIKEAHGV